MTRARILALGGDGIGPEVVGAALEVMAATARQGGLVLEVSEDLIGGASWDRHGTFCRDEVVAAARAADGVLVGAVGGPKWDGLELPGGPTDKDGLVRLRKALDVYAGLRPARAWAPLLARTPFRPEHVAGADVMVVRELVSGIYFGEPRGIAALPDGGFEGVDANRYTSAEIARVARVGFTLARRRRGRLASIDKANVMESGVLWRRVVGSVAAEFPDVALTHLYADNALYQLMRAPGSFDVILGDNLFGDLISDLAAILAGSLGMLPSASLCGLPAPGERARPGIYEAVHGSAPDIAGQGIANPMGTILSVAMLFEYGLARPDLARQVVTAVERTLAQGVLTPDLGGSAGTAAVTRAVIGNLG
jgi:3-isopropylmalate dehydrogenase